MANVIPVEIIKALASLLTAQISSNDDTCTSIGYSETYRAIIIIPKENVHLNRQYYNAKEDSKQALSLIVHIY
jgi:hypothetical protein